MPESDDVTYLGPQGLASLAQEKMDEAGDTGYAVAQKLGHTRSYVYRALRTPDTSCKSLYQRILALYDVEVDTERPAYPVRT